jgi:beta-galactosidase
MRGRDQLEFTKHFQRLIRANRSLSLYVAHGGTNFGLTAGANGFPNNDYMPHITSYDYDAPINEHGAPTSKYFSIRTIMKEHLNQELPLIPIDIKTISIKPFKPSEIQAYLFANLDKEPTISNGLLSYF